MWYYFMKVALTTTLIVAILASILLVSVLAMIWLFVETKKVEKVSELSSQVF